MILGLGIDLVEIERVRRLEARWPRRLAARLLADDEWPAWELARDPGLHLAKRFAVKEAAAKALGTGIADGVAFRDLVVSRHPAQRPILELRGGAARVARELGVTCSHVSLSDERTGVVAVVVLEGDPGGASPQPNTARR